MNPGRMLAEVLKALFSKTATHPYPAKKLDMPGQYRGKLFFYPAKCIGCKMCERDCPADAIKITKLADKKFKADINLGKCIYCAQCVESCPKKALEATNNIELAQLDPRKLEIVYEPVPGDDASAVSPVTPAAPPQPPPPGPHEPEGGIQKQA
ncbi:MAG: 4Fe-4S binding protein [Candidatus Omnitrophota bacterium]